jgi:hypothetical protein
MYVHQFDADILLHDYRTNKIVYTIRGKISQFRTGPEGSRRLWIQDFMATGI